MSQPIDIIVDNRVRIPLAQLSVARLERLRESFTHDNPDERPDPPFYRTYRTEGRSITFPRGGMSRVRDVLRDDGAEWKVQDRRSVGDFDKLDMTWGGEIPKHNLKLWDFQERVVEAMGQRQNCIIVAITGSGKTTSALSFAARHSIPTLIIVNTGGLRKQWVKRIMKELGVRKDAIGIIGDGKRRTAPITIAMQQTLARGIEQDWIDAFGMIICDEVDLFAAPTFYDAVDPWRAKYRVGLTSTLERHDGKTFMVRDLFGDVATEVTKDEAIAKGKIVEVEVRMIETFFKADWYKRAVASRNRFIIQNSYHKLLREMGEDFERNEMVCEVVKDAVAEGDQAMVFSLRREHCFELDRMFMAIGLRTGVMLGGAEAANQFEITTERLNAGTLDVVVGTEKAIGRGQDFPSVSVGVITMPFANNDTLMKQVAGRLCRACEEKGKTKGVLYYFWDRKLHGRKPLENLLKNFSVLVRDGDDWRAGREVLKEMKPSSKRKSFVRKVVN